MAKKASRRVARLGLALAILLVSGRLNIPLGPVPISFQVFAILFCALLLGARDAVLLQAAYVFLGLLGLPVFTRGGGFAYVLQPSFGYTLGFVAAAAVTGSLSRLLLRRLETRRSEGLATREMGFRETAGAFAAAALPGLLVIYLIGLPYMGLILRFYLSRPKDLTTILQIGFLTFIPTDLVQLVLAASAAALLRLKLPRTFRS